ncbi:MAG TPA: hypothetical protein VGI12_12240 [Vicinamibacterales bacterium]
MKRHVPVAIALLALASPAWAQKVTTVPDLTAQQVLAQMANAGTSLPVGEALALTTALEISTQPSSTSSGGFIFKLDPTTGLQARTITTFGPIFGERALTSGEGQVSVGATFRQTTYDRFGDFGLGALPFSSTAGSTPSATKTSTGNLTISSRTLEITGIVGVTDNLDIAAVVPLVSVDLAGTSSLIDGNGVNTRLAQTNGVFSGLGDISALAKYRFATFKGGPLPDPGGAAIVVEMRLPTGSRENLRGLGLTRTLVSFVVSGGSGRVHPHASGGFEFWNKGLDIDGAPGTRVNIRHQIQYTAGIELEAAPKLTILADFVGQRILGGGQIGTFTGPVTGLANVTSLTSMVAIDQGISKMLLAPGLKVNLKGKLAAALSAIITMQNNGLHSKVTPFAGINLTM